MRGEGEGGREPEGGIQHTCISEPAYQYMHVYGIGYHICSIMYVYGPNILQYTYSAYMHVYTYMNVLYVYVCICMYI